MCNRDGLTMVQRAAIERARAEAQELLSNASMFYVAAVMQSEDDNESGHVAAVGQMCGNITETMYMVKNILQGVNDTMQAVSAAVVSGVKNSEGPFSKDEVYPNIAVMYSMATAATLREFHKMMSSSCAMLVNMSNTLLVEGTTALMEFVKNSPVADQEELGISEDILSTLKKVKALHEMTKALGKRLDP